MQKITARACEGKFTKVSALAGCLLSRKDLSEAETRYPGLRRLLLKYQDGTVHGFLRHHHQVFRLVQTKDGDPIVKVKATAQNWRRAAPPPKKPFCRGRKKTNHQGGGAAAAAAPAAGPPAPPRRRTVKPLPSRAEAAKVSSELSARPQPGCHNPGATLGAAGGGARLQHGTQL
eukprot:COSAG01_NODE_4279_length_5181_cov_556.950433_7_plen_174_part_00